MNDARMEKQPASRLPVHSAAHSEPSIGLGSLQALDFHGVDVTTLVVNEKTERAHGTGMMANRLAGKPG